MHHTTWYHSFLAKVETITQFMQPHTIKNLQEFDDCIYSGSSKDDICALFSFSRQVQDNHIGGVE